tara:strand:+ start:373 stop:627 length:255 start_codon:yes stop_codon:yes gene_type:complete
MKKMWSLGSVIWSEPLTFSGSVLLGQTTSKAADQFELPSGMWTAKPSVLTRFGPVYTLAQVVESLSDVAWVLLGRLHVAGKTKH